MSEFGAAAAAAATENKPVDGGEPSSNGDNIEFDPEVLELAKELKARGGNRETAKQALDNLLKFEDENWRKNYFNQFLQSDAGKDLRKRFGREHLAELSASEEGKAGLAKWMSEVGVGVEREDTSELSAEQIEVRKFKAENNALQSRLEALERRTGDIDRNVKSRAEDQEKTEVFVQWAGTMPQMAPKAYERIATRAHQLAQLQPDKYGSPNGFAKALKEVFEDYTSMAPAVSAPKRPTSVKSSGGGVANSQETSDFEKMSLEEKIKYAAEDCATAASQG